MRYSLSRTIPVFGLFVCTLLQAADPPKPPTTTALSKKLTAACQSLTLKKDPGLNKVTCEAVDPHAALPEEVSKCRNEVLDAAVTALSEEAKPAITTQTDDLLNLVIGDSASVQRLHAVLDRRVQKTVTSLATVASSAHMGS